MIKVYRMTDFFILLLIRAGNDIELVYTLYADEHQT
jgi:hypothetical protein